MKLAFLLAHVEMLWALIPQMHIDSHEALGVLNTLFEILAPSSLRPVDMLLRSMFVTPSTMVSVAQSVGSILGLVHAQTASLELVAPAVVVTFPGETGAASLGPHLEKQCSGDTPCGAEQGLTCVSWASREGLTLSCSAAVTSLSSLF